MRTVAVNAKDNGRIVGWAKRSVPIMFVPSQGVDGHGLSAFAHPTFSGWYPGADRGLWRECMIGMQ